MNAVDILIHVCPGSLKLDLAVPALMITIEKYLDSV